MSKYTYSKRSETVLAECEFDLQLLAREMLALQIVDISVICGRRGKKAQDAAYVAGYSLAVWPDSRHNAIAPALSEAVDLAPWIEGRIPWEEDDEHYPLWYIMGGIALTVIKKHNLNITWGYYFPFPDLGHFVRRVK